MANKNKDRLISFFVAFFLTLFGALCIFWFFSVIKEPATPASPPKQVLEINSAVYDRIVQKDAKKKDLPLDSADFGRTNPFEKY